MRSAPGAGRKDGTRGLSIMRPRADVKTYPQGAIPGPDAALHQRPVVHQILKPGPLLLMRVCEAD